MKCAHTIAAIALSMLSVCHPLSPEEAKVVGTWQWLGMDAIGKLTFTRDHRVAECLLRGEAYEGDCPPQDIKHGRWWIRGDQVVYKIEDGFSDEATLPLQWFLDGGAPIPKGPSFRRIK
jgi:hypothetical protein